MIGTANMSNMTPVLNKPPASAGFVGKSLPPGHFFKSASRSHKRWDRWRLPPALGHAKELEFGVSVDGDARL